MGVGRPMLAAGLDAGAGAGAWAATFADATTCGADGARATAFQTTSSPWTVPASASAASTAAAHLVRQVTISVRPLVREPAGSSILSSCSLVSSPAPPPIQTEGFTDRADGAAAPSALASPREFALSAQAAAL